MREILFRGMRIDNGEWIEGSLRIISDVGQAYSADQYRTFIIKQSPMYSHFEVIPKTIGQFTGFSADKGDGTVLVYDGDIVSWKGKVFEIQKNCGTPCLVRHQGDMFDIFEDNAWNDHAFPLVQFNWHYCDISEPCLEVEVIGNIHDNPELLEVE